MVKTILWIGRNKSRHLKIFKNLEKNLCFLEKNKCQNQFEESENSQEKREFFIQFILKSSI